MNSKKNSTLRKTCILTTVHSPFDIRIFHKEAKSLLNAGYTITLIAQHDRNEVVDGIKIVPLKKPRNRFERMTKTVWQAYQKALKTDADIYHFHDPELISVGLLLKFHGKRVIYDVHEDVPRQNLSKPYIPVVFRKPMSSAIEFIEAFSAKRFDGVVTATPFINRRFLRLGATSVNVNNYSLLSELYDLENQWEKKEKVVCYVGGVTHIRGAFEMIKAIGKTEYKLLLAGDIQSDIMKKLKRNSGWQQVEALGFVDRKRVKDILRHSVCGLVLFHPVPNHIDAQPNKMFEYMSAGLPVIASNFSLWRKIIEGSKCGMCVNPLDAEEIANAIKWIIEHPAQAKQMGENGRKAVEARYNWERDAEMLINLYGSLVQEG